MSIGKYICAFTELGTNYPQFFNAYQHGDEIELTMRDKVKDDGTCGGLVTMRIPAVLFGVMLEDAKKNFK